MNELGEVRVETIDTLEALRRLAPQVRSLHAASADQSPFTTLGFIESYAEHNEYFAEPGSLQLRVACAFCDGELVGYAPLKRVRERAGLLRHDKLEFLCTHDSALPHVVTRRGDEVRISGAIVDHILTHQTAFTVLELKEQTRDSPLLVDGNARARPGFYARVFPGADTAVITRRWNTLGDYFGALSKKQRSNVARQVRKLLDLNGLELVSACHPASLDVILALYLDLEARSWKSDADVTIARHPSRLAFVRDLIAKADPFELSVDVLCAHGEPLAGIINGRYGGRLYALHIAYDERFHGTSPGVLMVLWSMKRVIEERLASYDLLHGSTYYKTRWLADIVTTQSVQYFRRGSAAHLRARLGELWRFIRRAPRSAKADVVHNAVKRAIVARTRPHISAEIRTASRDAVARCKCSAGTVVHDRNTIARCMPFPTGPRE
jgi:CelD/BcsL family acetyltransferase involved in cellulose biosynthesis